MKKSKSVKILSKGDNKLIVGTVNISNPHSTCENNVQLMDEYGQRFRLNFNFRKDNLLYLLDLLSEIETFVTVSRQTILSTAIQEYSARIDEAQKGIEEAEEDDERENSEQYLEASSVTLSKLLELKVISEAESNI